MRSCVFTTFLLTVLPGLLLAQQPGISKDTNFYSGTPGLQARVARFTAQPSTSKAGQPVRLEWVVENPIGVSIEPGTRSRRPSTMPRECRPPASAASMRAALAGSAMGKSLPGWSGNRLAKRASRSRALSHIAASAKQTIQQANGLPHRVEIFKRIGPAGPDTP